MAIQLERSRRTERSESPPNWTFLSIGRCLTSIQQTVASCLQTRFERSLHKSEGNVQKPDVIDDLAQYLHEVLEVPTPISYIFLSCTLRRESSDSFWFSTERILISASMVPQQRQTRTNRWKRSPERGGRCLEMAYQNLIKSAFLVTSVVREY